MNNEDENLTSKINKILENKEKYRAKSRLENAESYDDFQKHIAKLKAMKEFNERGK